MVSSDSRAVCACMSWWINILPDSKYACGVVHVFRKLWEQRSLWTCRGKTLAHESLITLLLEVVNLPKWVAIMYVRGHQAGYLEEAIGNSLAGEKTQKVTFLPELSKVLLLLPATQSLPQKLPFPPELEIIKNSGAEKKGENWFIRDCKLDTRSFGPRNIKTTPRRE